MIPSHEGSRLPSPPRHPTYSTRVVLAVVFALLAYALLPRNAQHLVQHGTASAAIAPP